MLDTYFKTDSSNNIRVNAPSSIVGTLVKSVEGSNIIALKQGSIEWDEFFRVRIEKGYNAHKLLTSNIQITVIQVMLANDGIVYVEYVVKS